MKFFKKVMLNTQENIFTEGMDRYAPLATKGCSQLPGKTTITSLL